VSVLDKPKISPTELGRKTVSVHRRLRELILKSREMVQKVLAIRQYASTEKEVTQTLIPFFKEQGQSIVSRLQGLEKKSVKTPAFVDATSLVALIFNPDEWHDELTNLLLPVLAKKMAEAGVAHLMSLGIDVRKKGDEKSTKTTTATEWVNENSGAWISLTEAMAASGISLGIMTEIPDWMQQSIATRLTESFSQPYWKSVSKTTGGDAERVLRKGLSDGWSINRMSTQLREHYSEGEFRYARRRSENVARTESGNALNAARKDSVAQLQKEVGPKLPMKQTWLSVLGNTTRAAHANLDGVPEDENGMWNLAGYMVPWPGHFSLPPEQRCNCFPAGVLVSGDFTGSQRAWYEGRFTKIVTRKGTSLTLTANHPVVTSKGLVAAGMIQPGDKVLTYDLQVDCSFLRTPIFQKLSVGAKLSNFWNDSGNNINYEPVSIEKVFETLLMVSRVKIKSAGKCDFYGDGEFIQGDIEIVGSDRILPEDIESIVGEESENFFLESSKSSGALSSVFGVSSQHELFGRSFHSTSGIPGIAEPLFGCFRSVPGVSPSCSLAVGVAADFDISLSESISKDGSTIAGFLRESLKRHTRLVEFDEVVEIGDFYSVGHIYDLQSRWGLIVASDPLYTDNQFQPRGIVTSNCQCSLTIDFGMSDEDAQRELEEYAARAGIQGT